jgi:hypothetical protein
MTEEEKEPPLVAAYNVICGRYPSKIALQLAGAVLVHANGDWWEIRVDGVVVDYVDVSSFNSAGDFITYLTEFRNRSVPYAHEAADSGGQQEADAGTPDVVGFRDQKPDDERRGVQ